MPKDETVQFRESDARMSSAIEEARRTLGDFFKALGNPSRNQNSFLLKVIFEEDGTFEHIWIADLRVSNSKLIGVVANDPQIRSLQFKQEVEVNPADISDWMYIEDGYLIGGYTTKVIRAGLAPEQKAAHDAAAPYKFHD